MASFSDSPLEVAAEIIEALQDDLTALKACSLTCRSLLPLCRRFIFRSIELVRSFTAQRHGLPRNVILFGRLLDSNPKFSDYVQNLVYQIQPQDFNDYDVPRILTQFRRLQSFCLIGGDAVWDTLRQPLRESLLRIIRLPSITSLEISYLRVFPIALFSFCSNLTTLVLTHIGNDSMDEYQKKYPIPNEVPQPSSFTFGVSVGNYVGRLVSANQSNGLPVLSFHNVRSLSVNVDKYSGLQAVHALLKATHKLETLEYIVDDSPDGFRGLAASMNLASLPTLRKIEFEFDINDDIQDPLCGISAELRSFSGINKFEEIILRILVQTDCRCKTASDQWGTLDAALATGFPMLKRVSVHIFISTFSSYSNGVALKEELDRLPEDQFPQLSTSLTVSFNFSTEVDQI